MALRTKMSFQYPCVPELAATQQDRGLQRALAPSSPFQSRRTSVYSSEEPPELFLNTSRQGLPWLSKIS